jgi:hypothetical protein
VHKTFRPPVPAEPGVLLLLCVFGGAYFGCLPTATSYVISLENGPLYLIYKVSFPGNFFVSCVIGGPADAEDPYSGSSAA